jgi:phospholipase C
MVLLLGTVLAVLLGSSPVTAGSLRDIEHVVIFMQENRAWDTVSLSYPVSRLVPLAVRSDNTTQGDG